MLLTYRGKLLNIIFEMFKSLLISKTKALVLCKKIAKSNNPDKPWNTGGKLTLLNVKRVINTLIKNSSEVISLSNQAMILFLRRTNEMLKHFTNNHVTVYSTTNFYYDSVKSSYVTNEI